MSMSMRDKMRKRINESKGGGVDAAIFPFWEMGYDSTSNIRLLPFEDELSGAFWTIKKSMNLTFVDPENDEKTVSFRVNSPEMHSTEKCEIANQVRAIFDHAKVLKEDEGDMAGHKIYYDAAVANWMKYVYYYQGFVNKAPFDDKAPDNPIRIFPFTKQIHMFIESAVTDDDDPMEYLPTGEFYPDDVAARLAGAYDGPDTAFLGKNLLLKKVRKGEFANWETSRWSNDWVDLTDEQLAALDEHGLFDLRSRLPKAPNAAQLEVLTEMMKVSLDFALGLGDGAWDKEWEAVDGIKPFRPRGSGGSGDSKSGGSVKERVAAKAADKKSSSGVNSLKAKLAANRGKAKDEPADEPAEDQVNEDQAEDQVEDQMNEDQAEDQMNEDQAEDKAPPKKKSLSALSERINKKKAA